MQLTLLIDPPQDGLTNMAVDEALLAMAAAGELGPVLRFYRWSPATLSLGYFQRYAERAAHPASAACDVVRRASGGGAILHDNELTYSLVLPAGHPLAARPEPLYRAVHQALIEVLAEASGSAGASLSPAVEARFWEDVRPISGSAAASPNPGTFACGDAQPSPPHPPSRAPAPPEPFLCFRRRSPGDVVMRVSGDPLRHPLAWHKILGSAQRRRHGAVLQHGSLLLAQSLFAPELLGIRELAGTNFADLVLSGLEERWSEKLAQMLDFELAARGLSEQVLSNPQEQLAWEKFHEASWLHSR